MQYHAIPCNIMQYRVVPCNTVQYHAIQCNTMQYHSKPCKTIQYHACLLTADGAYHCPVGSIWPFFSQERLGFVPVISDALPKPDYLINVETRTNLPRNVRDLILDSDSRSQGVKGYAFRVSGGQRKGFHGCRVSRGRPKRTQQVKGQVFRVPRGQGVGLQGLRGSMGRPSASQRVGQQGPRGSKGRPTGSQGWAE